MSTAYTKLNLHEVEDAAAKRGMSDMGEARFPRTVLHAEATGLAYHKLPPGRRQGFAHRHGEAEELHVVLAGGGVAELDGERVPLGPMDALRVAPTVLRIFEAGPEGLEYLVFGPHHPGDGEMVPQ